MVVNLNVVCLTGRIVSDIDYKVFEKTREDGNDLLCAGFTLLVMEDYRNGTRVQKNYFKCQAYGAQARNMRKRDLGRGDYVAISGRLRYRRWYPGKNDPLSPFPKRSKALIFIRITHWQGLFRPPTQFIKGHAIVPVDEYRRLRSLTADATDLDVPQEKLRELGMLEPSAFEPGEVDSDEPDGDDGLTPDFA